MIFPLAVFSLCIIGLIDYTTVNEENDDDSSSEWENSDSAVESSEDEDEMVEQDTKPKNHTNTDSDSSQKDTDNKSDFLSFLGPKGTLYLLILNLESLQCCTLTSFYLYFVINLILSDNYMYTVQQ